MKHLILWFYWLLSLLLMTSWVPFFMLLWLVNFVTFLYLWYIQLIQNSHRNHFLSIKKWISPLFIDIIYHYIFPLVTVWLIFSLLWFLIYWISKWSNLLIVLIIRLLTLWPNLNKTVEEWLVFANQKITWYWYAFIWGFIIFVFALYNLYFVWESFIVVIVSWITWYFLYIVFCLLAWKRAREIVTHITHKLFLILLSLILFFGCIVYIPSWLDGITLEKKVFVERKDISELMNDVVFEEDQFTEQESNEIRVLNLLDQESLREPSTDIFLDTVEQEFSENEDDQF